MKLDENGKIKGWEETLKGLQTQFPNQFESSSQKKIEEHKLDNPQDNDGGMTKAESLKETIRGEPAYSSHRKTPKHLKH